MPDPADPRGIGYRGRHRRERHYHNGATIEQGITMQIELARLVDR